MLHKYFNYLCNYWFYIQNHYVSYKSVKKINSFNLFTYCDLTFAFYFMKKICNQSIIFLAREREL